MNINNLFTQHFFMRRILVTGFEVFSQHKTNISQDIISTLDEKIIVDDPWYKSRAYKLDAVEIELERKILTVDSFGSRNISERLGQGESWDAIIHMGLCDSCLIPRIELLASNILDMKIPDNLGRLEKNTKIGESNLKTKMNHEIIFSKILSQEFELSFDAGNYICNETYFHTLKAIANRKSDNEIPCIFLHLPNYDKITIENCKNLLSEVIGRMIFKPVISVAAGVIVHDSKMLVARRNDKQHSGYWEFPGGKLNLRENASDAIVRELYEEFGWNINSVEHLGNWFHSRTDYDIELIVQKCNFQGELPNFNDKKNWTSHDQIKWISDHAGVSPYVGCDEEVANAVSGLI